MRRRFEIRQQVSTAERRTDTRSRHTTTKKQSNMLLGRDGVYERGGRGKASKEAAKNNEVVSRRKLRRRLCRLQGAVTAKRVQGRSSRSLPHNRKVPGRDT